MQRPTEITGLTVLSAEAQALKQQLSDCIEELYKAGDKAALDKIAAAVNAPIGDDLAQERANILLAVDVMLNRLNVAIGGPR